jgi:uncharacterized paraquat-inducible protein A
VKESSSNLCFLNEERSFWMSIKFVCPHCETGLEAKSEVAGQEGNCPKCNKAITVPKDDSGGEAEPKDSG